MQHEYEPADLISCRQNFSFCVAAHTQAHKQPPGLLLMLISGVLLLAAEQKANKPLVAVALGRLFEQMAHYFLVPLTTLHIRMQIC